jgi:hypothetical protein
MILQEDVKPTIEFIKDLARYSGKYYEDKVPYEILDELISYGDIYCYFRTKNDAQVSASNWFPSISLIQDPEYTDIDMDYYISMECVDPEGLPVIGI